MHAEKNRAGVQSPPRRQHPFVQRLAQFLHLSDDDLDSLWQLFDADLKVAKRKDLVIDGFEYRKLCFVESGFASRYKLLRNGKRQIISLILPGDVIGLPGSFLKKACYSVIAVSEMKLQVCSINQYVRLCYKRPQFGLALSWLAVQETITCAEHAINTGRRTPPERLAHFFLEIYSRLEAVGLASEHGFDLPFSQEVMSDVLGLSVPHLSKTLTKLRNDGLLEVTGRRVRLVDLQALEMLSHFQAAKLADVPHARNAVPV
jgi:CRP-like cAMP-binding protein